MTKTFLLFVEWLQIQQVCVFRYSYRQHRDVLCIETPSSSTCPPSIVSDITEVLSSNSTLDLECIYENSPGRTALQHAVDQILEKDEEVQEKKEALFILNLKEVRGLSEAAVDHILGETSKMFRHSLGRIEAGVNDCLAKNGVDPNDLPDLQNFFSSVKYPFQHLHSTYLQEKFYHQEFVHSKWMLHNKKKMFPEFSVVY